MGEQSAEKMYRVVAFQSDGIIGCIQVHLSKAVADDMRITLAATYPRVLIEDDRLPSRGSALSSGSAP